MTRTKVIKKDEEMSFDLLSACAQSGVKVKTITNYDYLLLIEISGTNEQIKHFEELQNGKEE